jgi:hypothetical protein
MVFATRLGEQSGTFQECFAMWPIHLDREPTYTPSEEEIELQCRAIREGWTVREKRKRRRWSDVRPLDVGVIPASAWLAAAGAATERLRGE